MIALEKLTFRTRGTNGVAFADAAAGSGMRRGLYTSGPAMVHVLTASKQRLVSCVTTTLTRRALCDISFGHLIIVWKITANWVDSPTVRYIPVRMISRRGGLHRCHAVPGLLQHPLYFTCSPLFACSRSFRRPNQQMLCLSTCSQTIHAAFRELTHVCLSAQRLFTFDR